MTILSTNITIILHVINLYFANEYMISWHSFFAIWRNRQAETLDQMSRLEFETDSSLIFIHKDKWIKVIIYLLYHYHNITIIFWYGFSNQ